MLSLLRQKYFFDPPVIIHYPVIQCSVFIIQLDNPAVRTTGFSILPARIAENAPPERFLNTAHPLRGRITSQKTGQKAPGRETRRKEVVSPFGFCNQPE